ncbi:zinc-ribbon domain-containing protein [Methanobacterium sp.]|uniref:zinc-ribbon domain-containing protein n=1 Tax=Methanobacterium sp. TaxID=2164 RepID=UPI003C78F1D1
MICDNCGAEIDNKERYCPNCGMELPTSKSSKKKNYKNSQQFTSDNFQSKKKYRNYSNEEYLERRPSRRRETNPSDFAYDIPHPKADYTDYNEEEDYKRKPLKRKYYGNSAVSTRHDSHYQDDVDYESYYDYGEENITKTKKSRISLGTICLFMVMILLLGFVIGLMLFSNTQVIPSVPGFNS